MMLRFHFFRFNSCQHAFNSKLKESWETSLKKSISLDFSIYRLRPSWLWKLVESFIIKTKIFQSTWRIWTDYKTGESSPARIRTLVAGSRVPHDWPLHYRASCGCLTISFLRIIFSVMSIVISHSVPFGSLNIQWWNFMKTVQEVKEIATEEIISGNDT